MDVTEESPMKTGRPRRSGRSGFTFVEMVVAMFILAIGMAGVYRVLQMAMQSRQAAQFHYTAAVIANNRIEFAKNLPFGFLGLLVESGVAVDDLGIIDASGNYRRSTVLEPSYLGDPDLARIAVTVNSPTFIRVQTNRLAVTVSTILTTYNSP